MKLLILFILIFVCLSCEGPKEESPQGFSDSSKGEVRQEESTLIMKQREARSRIQKEGHRNRLIHENTNFNGKVQAATQYINSFEHENWSGIARDNLSVRRALTLKDLREFLEFTKYYHTRFENISPFHMDKASNENKVFFAISAALNSTSENQKKILRENTQIDKINFYTVIHKGLIGRAETNFDQKLIDIIRSAEYYPVVIDLLKARYGLYLSLGVKDFMVNSNIISFDKITSELYGFTYGRIGKLNLDVDLSKRNFANQIDIIKKFSHAAALKSILDNENEYEIEERVLDSIEKLHTKLNRKDTLTLNEQIVLGLLEDLLN